MDGLGDDVGGGWGTRWSTYYVEDRKRQATDQANGSGG